ncbi:MAG: biopolymer transporter ExbD [Trueperaceae bacterium]
MRRRPRFTRRDTTLDLTPMVDVVFLLIIFFMVSTTFITLESGLPVDLPQASSSQAQATDIPTVTVTSEQVIFLAGTEIQESELVAALRAQLEATGQGVVVFRADQSVPHGLAVRVYDLIRQSGAQRISIATGG